MTEREPRPAQDHEFQEVVPEPGPVPAHLEINDLGRIRLPVTADLGKRDLSVRDILELKVGSLIKLEKIAGEQIDVYANGAFIGRGEIVPIGEVLHVRITEIVGATDRGVLSPSNE